MTVEGDVFRRVGSAWDRPAVATVNWISVQPIKKVDAASVHCATLAGKSKSGCRRVRCPSAGSHDNNAASVENKLMAQSVVEREEADSCCAKTVSSYSHKNESFSSINRFDQNLVLTNLPG